MSLIQNQTRQWHFHFTSRYYLLEHISSQRERKYHGEICCVTPAKYDGDTLVTAVTLRTYKAKVCRDI